MPPHYFYYQVLFSYSQASQQAAKHHDPWAEIAFEKAFKHMPDVPA
jgi:hypothetical protein